MKQTTQSQLQGRRIAALGVTLCVLCAGQAAQAQWPQWGGANRDFKAAPAKLADKWPEGGPKHLWKRTLGDGYSTIIVDDGCLFTMYRTLGDDGKPGPEETVVCLDAKSGKTIWESKYEAPALEGQTDGFGWGPNPTPLIVGDRIFTSGFTARFHCLNKKTGEVLWAHDLVSEHGCKAGRFGYSISPIAYKDTVITMAGGEGETFVAFNQSDGSVAWKSQSFDVGHSSPILADYHGQAQLVAIVSEKIVGINPADGSLLWEHAMPDASNMGSPVYGDDDIIFCSSAYKSGSRAIKLSTKDGKIKAEELWYTRKVRVHFGNSIRLGDHVYAPSGQDGPAFLSCLDVHTGKVAWRQRGYAKATFCYADEKLYFLDEQGKLGLAKISPEGIEVISECKISESRCWSAPTIVGTTMYIRDRSDILSLDLSAKLDDAA